MPRRDVYCASCESNQPMVETDPLEDELNIYPWYDIICATCSSVIASIRIVPDDYPQEESKAVRYGPVLVEDKGSGKEQSQGGGVMALATNGRLR